MFHREDGPGQVFKKIREAAGIEHDDEGPLSYPEGSVLACVGCLSVWGSLVLACAPRPVRRILAASALAILAELGTVKLRG